MRTRFLNVGGPGSSSISFSDASIAIGSSGNGLVMGPGSTASFNNSSYIADGVGSISVEGSAAFNSSIAKLPGTASVGGPGPGGAGLSLISNSVLATGMGLTVGNGNQGTVNISGGSSVGYYKGQGPINIGSLGYGSNGVVNVTGGSDLGNEFINIGGLGDNGILSVTGSGSTATAVAEISVNQGGTLLLATGGEVETFIFNMSVGSTLAIALDEGGIIVDGGFGRATLAGSLDVTQGSVPDPTLGETFDLLSFGSETGTFSSITLPPLDPGLGWSTQNLYTNGSISVIAVPEPATVGLLAASMLRPLSRRRHQRQ